MDLRRAFITILAISTVVGPVAGCKKSADAKRPVPVVVAQESVNGIPREKILGDFIYPQIARFFKLKLSDDQTYRLETVFLPDSDDERVVAKTYGTWSFEKSVIVLTPASSKGNDVFGDFLILDPEISKEGQVSFSTKLKDGYETISVGFLRPDVLFSSPENVPSEIPDSKPHDLAHR